MASRSIRHGIMLKVAVLGGGRGEGGLPARGEVSAWGDLPGGLPARQNHRHVKTLPCRNYVVDGKYVPHREKITKVLSSKHCNRTKRF